MGIQSATEETMNRLFCLLSTLCLVSSNAVPQNRTEKAFPIFSIVKFANDDCVASGTGATARMGTCYTAEECTNRKGTAGASCAEGFGICCEFTLNGPTNRGKSVAENHVRISDASTTAGAVTYTVCPCGSDICRIRFNFNQLTLADQVQGTVGAAAAAQAQAGSANAIGSCQTDTFMISGATAGTGSPVICGVNDGHHMILDSDGTTCHTINIMMGAGGGNRNWQIDVEQFRCGNLDTTLAGPPGCLQYHTAANGRISDYGSAALPAAPTAGPALAADTTHLANQEYRICIRRNAGQCRICYTVIPPVIAEGVADQAGFGLSISTVGGASDSQVDAGCLNQDFISIPGAQNNANSIIANNQNGIVQRLCGRRFNVAANQAASAAVCTRLTPYMIGVNFGAGETAAGNPPGATEVNSELVSAPGGIVGFRLAYAQSCP